MIKNRSGSDSILDEVIKFFDSETPLKEAEKYGGRTYEERPQQKEMALNVACSLIEPYNLCVEAPTGVGKSFAYLIPAIFYALKQPRPIVITTETINLQEQLIFKDIPILKKLTDVDFKASLAKGRTNYLCRRRLEMSTGDHQGEYLPNNSMMSDIAKITEWAEKTKDGSLSDMEFEPSLSVWHCICCEHGNCFGPKCKYFNKCFYWSARKEWEKSNLLVTNHALFLSDLKMKTEGEIEGGILPQYSGVIIDEAHQLETNTAKYMGTRISEPGLLNMLTRLYNPDRGRGLLIRPGSKAIELRQITGHTFEYVKTFFNQVREYMSTHEATQRRIHRPYIVEDVITGQLALLERKLDEYLKIQDDDNYKLELDVQLQKCRGYTKSIFEFLMMNAEDSVYWIELEDNYNRQYVTLNYSPLNVPEILNRSLFTEGYPVTITSATLSVANRLNFYKSRVGFVGKELILSSPFNYATQSCVFIPKGIPDPRDNFYESSISEQIKKYVIQTEGKAFVLFTSYSLLSKVKQMTSEYFAGKGITLIAQGDGISRSNMLKFFKKDVNSVIFGTTSFWMGVDVPGEALSNVIITKLPFSVPSEPLIEARLDKLKEEGRNPFMEYSLPEAVLKFKQGIGRLIRSKTDTGIIVLLDNRLITKRYGKIFLDSLPPCPIKIV
ncbi:MAG TPA: helicase C-terminal domain-containing protein [Victivallales bacterium]|nr:helicase C-terminal domain-containing protein [Victivallales bacterium]